jgi:hypothetical protein
MEEVLQNITGNSESFIMFLIFGVGGTIGGIIAITAITLGTRQNVRIEREREESRREIAAYVAEGSITPEDAERLLSVGKKKSATELVLDKSSKRA